MLNPNAEPIPQDDLPPDGGESPAVGEVVAETLEVLEEVEDGEGEHASPLGDDGDELIITLGDEPAPEVEATEDTPVIRQMRQRLRDQARELANLRRAQTVAHAPAQPDIADPGPMPTIESFEFDGEKHAEAVTDWVARKTAADSAKAQRAAAQQQEQQAWLARVQGYEAEKKALKVPNFVEAEDNVLQALSLAQQGLLLKSKDHAKLVYALGNSPKRLQALAAITDPVDFVYAVAEVRHKELKVQQRSKPPVPERVPAGGSGSGAGTVIASTRRLAELQEQARKTGDYSNYLAEKRRAEGKRAA